MKENLTLKPSAEQEAIFDWVAAGGGNALVEAVAGSGKTTTLVQALKRMNGSICFMAYNKKAALDIQAKCTEEGLSEKAHIGTVHSFGYAMLRASKAFPKPDDWERFGALAEKFSLEREHHVFFKNLLSMAKQRGFGIPGEVEFRDPEAWKEMIETFSLADDLPEGLSIDAAIPVAAKMLQASKFDYQKFIDFDDMIWLPLVLGLKPPSVYQWVLLDEAQDTNPSRRALARALLAPGGRFIAVGDPCQPPCTLISVVTKIGDRWNPRIIQQKRIDEVKVGDTVVGYNQADCAFYYNRKIEGITVKSYVGKLITVTTDSGKLSQYTSNHHCFASFSPLRNKLVIYMMRKGNRYRIGKAKMDYGENGSGPIRRAFAEKADALWLLRTMDNTNLALAEEAFIQTNFGIPDIVFNQSEEVWQRFDSINLESRAIKCLEFYGRDMSYPIWQPGGYTSFKRPAIYHACNLLDGALMLPLLQHNHAKKEDWEIISLSKEDYNGPVFSLTVSDNHLYIADKLVTHNCQAIYGFTGADNDSLKLIARDFNTQSLPLHTSFRCSKTIIAEAQKYVSHIKAFESNSEGRLHDLWTDNEEWTKSVVHTDVILCRNTRPLVSLAFRFIRAGKAAKVEGRKIGDSLKALAKKFRYYNRTEFNKKLSEYRIAEVAKLKAKKKGFQAGALDDKLDSLHAVADGCGERFSKQALLDRIDSIFAEGPQKGAITLCTIHRAKGLEWDKVYWLHPNKLQPSPFAQQEWELEQENNLCYVAITRARKELVIVNLKETS